MNALSENDYGVKNWECVCTVDIVWHCVASRFRLTSLSHDSHMFYPWNKNILFVYLFIYLFSVIIYFYIIFYVCSHCFSFPQCFYHIGFTFLSWCQMIGSSSNLCKSHQMSRSYGNLDSYPDIPDSNLATLETCKRNVYKAPPNSYSSLRKFPDWTWS